MTYKYKATLDKIREVLLQYESNLEAMCDLATCLLTQLVPNILVIAGEVHTYKRIQHVWAFDDVEKYYIDITSEQFGFPPCLCSKDISVFEKKGYVVTHDFHIWNGAFHICKELKHGPVILYKGNEITMADILSEIAKKKRSRRWFFFGGTRRRR
jgi:hypothetical protein